MCDRPFPLLIHSFTKLVPKPGAITSGPMLRRIEPGILANPEASCLKRLILSADMSKVNLSGTRRGKLQAARLLKRVGDSKFLLWCPPGRHTFTPKHLRVIDNSATLKVQDGNVFSCGTTSNQQENWELFPPSSEFWILLLFSLMFDDKYALKTPSQPYFKARLGVQVAYKPIPLRLTASPAPEVCSGGI